MIGNFPDELKEVPEDKIEILSITDDIITYRINHTQIQIGLIEQGDKDVFWMLTKCEYEK